MRFGGDGQNDVGTIATSGEMLAKQGFTFVHMNEFVQAFGEHAQAQYDSFLATVARMKSST
jgi:hypothetical protein